MPKAIVTTHAAHASASKRTLKSTGLVSHVASTGVFTIAAGFLNELAPNDTVSFLGLTGGSGITAGQDYYLTLPRWNLGATTFQVGTTPNGAVLVGGTNATAGTVSTGSLAQADGFGGGNYISADSPLAR